MRPVLPQYHPQKHTADKAAAISGACIIYAVQIQGDGAQADIQLCDALTDGSEDELDYSVADGDTVLYDYSPLGGVGFGTGLTVDVTGAGATVTIWTDKNQVTA